MAKRKQKVKRVSTRSKKTQLQNISKINITIGDKYKKPQEDRVSLERTYASSTSYLPTVPSGQVLLEAPNRQMMNVPEPLRRSNYATLPASMNPVTIQPVVNGSAKDPQPSIGVPIIQAGNVNDLAPRQAQSTLVKNRNVIPNLSSASTILSRPSYSAPSTPLSVPPQNMLQPRQREYSFLDLVERNPNDAQAPVDIQQANALQNAMRTPIRQPVVPYQPYVRSSGAKGRPSMEEGVERMRHSEEQFYRMMGQPKKLSQ